MSVRLRKTLIFALLYSLRGVRRLIVSSPRLQRRLLRPGLEPVLWRVGQWRAWLAFDNAYSHVPAYRSFVDAAGRPKVGLDGWTPDFSELPVTDKDNYVRAFPPEERCKGGALPMRGVVIDESSGTSGEATNWVRGAAERVDGTRMLQAGMLRTFGDDPLFVINTFALGPWATGMNVTMSTVDVAIVKSVGPDVVKVENTFRAFGPGYRYLVCGYPPFLKHLVDTADIAWDTLTVLAAVGGEGMSEPLREHLEQFFVRVVSSFGASDLEINIAVETPFSVRLRRLLGENDTLAGALELPDRATLPMVFQFNPLDYLIESDAEDELIFTVNRLDTVSPKIRYNLRDVGAVRRFRQVEAALRGVGIAPAELDPTFIDLPLLFHYGRSDATVAFFGANIAPADVQAALIDTPQLAVLSSDFALVVGEDDQANKTLEIALALTPGKQEPDATELEQLRQAFLSRLTELNQDYRAAHRLMPAERRPRLAFYPAEHAFFAHDVRLKKQYVHEG